MTYDVLIPSRLMAALLPDLILMVGGMVLMLFSAWRRDSAEHQRSVGLAAMALIVVTIGAVVWMAMGGATAPTNGPIAVDGFRWVTDIVVLLAALATIALAVEYNARHGISHPESHVLVLFGTAGMMILAAGRDLMVVFLGIEIMSVAVYVLTGLNRRSARAAEASLKYFLLGAFATGFLLYGIALVYGATGTTQFTEISTAIREYNLHEHPMLWVGIGLMLIGLGFKVAAVPFHMWAPDVYDGSPTPTSAFMIAAVKAAAFATFLRLWYEGFYYTSTVWHSAVWWLAAITMVVGNVVALAQGNIKRMLAYSSIAHAGYLLVTVASANGAGTSAFLFYIFAYTLATFGAFAVIGVLEHGGDRPAMIWDYEGLWHTRPWLASAMAVFMLALLGFPFFGGIGFFAKWYVLQAALASPQMLASLAVILVLTSLVSAGYYLQVVRVMFMKQRPEGAVEPPAIGAFTRAVIGVTAVLILGFGLFPSQLVRVGEGSGMPQYPFSPALGIKVPAPLR
ncbi:MAG TPA: NADH-quinone oxidoreductase subunit N [Gemmatimonadaceae bacterium]|nr:NADH-quinone oxidoreductase subunit N [Gemmatimonadaceae bacterium]